MDVILNENIFLALTGEFNELNPYLQAHDLPDDIEAIHPQLLVCIHDIEVIRDVVAGEKIVKDKGEKYLPRTRDNQSDAEYKRVKHHTTFFPAAAQTMHGKKGLMLARNVNLDAPALDPIKNIITANLASVREMAEQSITETLQTNFTGLLVDHPDPANGVTPNAKDAIDQGFRPYLHVFPFETILWIDNMGIGGARVPRRVVVRQSFNEILELRLDAGIYWQRLWRSVDGANYAIEEVSRPTRDGQPLNRIPWVIVSDNTYPYPQPSVLQNIVKLNLAHYSAESMTANLSLFGSAVVPFVTGIKMDRDPATGAVVDPKVQMTTGAVMLIEDANGKAEFMEPRGHMATALQNRCLDISEMMAKVGSRVLASEKAAPEDATVVAMRNMGEDANTASLAVVYAERISAALSIAAWWMGSEPFTGQEAT